MGYFDEVLQKIAIAEVAADKAGTLPAIGGTARKNTVAVSDGDGAAAQWLAPGNPSDILQKNGVTGVPEWAPPNTTAFLSTILTGDYMVSIAPIGGDADWSIVDSGGGSLTLRCAAGTRTTRKYAVLQVQAPRPFTISGVSMLIAGSSYSALPGTMPQIGLKRHQQLGGVVDLGTATDASATLSAYNNDHTVTLSGLSAASLIDSNQQDYRLIVASDADPSALPELLLKVAWATLI